MKKTTTLLIAAFTAQACIAQVSGNINYINGVRYPESNIEVSFPAGKNLLVSVKGMANIKADSCVAIFSIIQTGKTADEASMVMDGRANQCISKLKTKKNLQTYIDMVSFVPMYEYEEGKKIFSKKTYNEVPVGFELKKNLHIKYANQNDLNEIVAVLANEEIYDLVRVDYFSSAIEAVKKDMMAKARTILLEKLKNYQLLLGIKTDTMEKQLVDGFRAMLPVEMYKSYQAYNSSPLQTTKYKSVQTADKSTTQYYQPVIDKEFDFVTNPVVFEPVIQVMYEIKMNIQLEKEKPAINQKEYILITPNGEMRSINTAAARPY